MSIFLNAFPLNIPDKELEACVIPYDAENLTALREKHHTTHAFQRQGENLLIFSADSQYPISGTVKPVRLKDNYGVFCFLFKDGLIRYLSGLNRRPMGFYPIELVSAKKEDNLLATIINGEYPFQIYVKYKLDTRIVQGVPCLTIDCSTKTTLNENCNYFIAQGFDLVDRYIAVEQDNGYRKLLGRVN